MLSVPFGVIGSFWSVFIFDYNISVAVTVGFIDLAGVEIETAIIMLKYIDQRVKEAQPSSMEEFILAVRSSAVSRLWTKIMTVSTIILGLIPIFIT